MYAPKVLRLLIFVSLPRSKSFSHASVAILAFFLASLSVLPLRLILFVLPVLGLIYLLDITHSQLPSSNWRVLPVPLAVLPIIASNCHFFENVLFAVIFVILKSDIEDIIKRHQTIFNVQIVQTRIAFDDVSMCFIWLY